MRYTPKQYAQSLFMALSDKEEKDRNALLDNFVNLLVRNNNLRLSSQIFQELKKLDLEKRGIKEVVVLSARDLGKFEEEVIKNNLKRLLNTEVELTKEVDETLVGGVKIKIDDQVIDATVKNYLQQLVNHMCA